jgi:glucan phosphoethanolaminetransferase (alkaline phosphatase superfamily)
LDELKREFKQNKGPLITCGIIFLFALLGGTIAILGPRIGEGNAALLGFGAVILIILISLGVYKGNKLAKSLAGILLMIIGFSLTVISLYDFVSSQVMGNSMFNRGLTAENYGVQMFILMAFGVGLFGLGLMLIGILK